MQSFPKKAKGTPKPTSKRIRKETAEPASEPIAKRVTSANRPIRSLADAVVELFKTTGAQIMERKEQRRKAAAESTSIEDFSFVGEFGPTNENVSSWELVPLQVCIMYA